MRLVLFFTAGMSLRTWARIGSLEREIAIYKIIRTRVTKVRFVTYGDGRDHAYADRLGGIGVTCNRWRLPRRLYAGLVSKVYPRLWGKDVIVKTNQIPGAEVAARAARCGNNRFVARCGYLHSDFIGYRYGENSSQAVKARRLENSVFATADRVVVTTSEMACTVARRYQVSPGRISVIPNHVDIALFDGMSGGGREVKRLCFVGRLDDQKNLVALFEAIAGLGVELVLVGTGPLEAKLRRRASADKSAVCFLGNVPHGQLVRVFQDADIFVLPSLYEGHPKALIEAMAAGLPVIGTRVPGIQELIHHGETGYLCGTSSKEIQNAIRRVSADFRLRRKMGRQARAHVAEHFSIHRVATMELEMMRELVR